MAELRLAARNRSAQQPSQFAKTNLIAEIVKEQASKPSGHARLSHAASGLILARNVFIPGGRVLPFDHRTRRRVQQYRRGVRLACEIEEIVQTSCQRVK